MNYYSFHIGDYIKQTVHLTPMEDLCYRRLLDMYYETELPIPTETDRVSRRLRLDTDLVDSVLNEFFERTENGWINARCDAEISAYHVKADAARSNGKLGGRPKKTQSVILANPAETGSKANQEPRTKNQLKEKVKKETRAIQIPADFVLNETSNGYAKERGVNITVELGSFRNWHTAKGSTYKDWQAAWRTWCDNAVRYGRATNPPMPNADTAISQEERDARAARRKAELKASRDAYMAQEAAATVPVVRAAQ